MFYFDNPNGASLEMTIQKHSGLGSSVKPFGNHPIKDRPQNI